MQQWYLSGCTFWVWGGEDWHLDILPHWIKNEAIIIYAGKITFLHFMMIIFNDSTFGVFVKGVDCVCLRKICSASFCTNICPGLAGVT